MVLYQYTELFFVTALVFTIFAFHKNTEKSGRIFYFFMGAMAWGVVAYGLNTIDFKWGGTVSVVDYTYIPAWESWVVTFGFGIMSILMFIIGSIRVISQSTNSLEEVYR
jgi:hypothetical protein